MMQGQYLINLSDKERFINAVSEIAEGDIHWENVRYNLVGDYSKAINCGDLDTFYFYEVAHEKNQQRLAMFGHMLEPFWSAYDPEHTKLTNSEKFLIFLKIMREVRNVYPLSELEGIFYAMEDKLNITPKESGRLQNGKMWHDYYLIPHYENYALPLLKRDSKGLYF